MVLDETPIDALLETAFSRTSGASSSDTRSNDPPMRHCHSTRSAEHLARRPERERRIPARSAFTGGESPGCPQCGAAAQSSDPDRLHRRCQRHRADAAHHRGIVPAISMTQGVGRGTERSRGLTARVWHQAQSPGRRAYAAGSGSRDVSDVSVDRFSYQVISGVTVIP